MPELGNNLSIVLSHLDDRDFAVEKDPRSPGGKGYTGFEALLQYVYDQTMAINTFDSNGYMLKVNLFLSECSDYQSLASLKEKLQEDPAFYQRCAAILGPHQPGITQPDPSYTGAQKGAEHHLPAAKKNDKKAPAKAEKPQDRRRASPPTRRRSAPRSWPSASRRRSASSCPSCPPVPRSPPCPSRCPSLPGGQQPDAAQTRRSSWTSCSPHEARLRTPPTPS